MIPNDLRFTKTHEWARLDPDGTTVTVGISAYAVEQLGDIVYIELPAVGRALAAGAPFGAIESVKAAVEIYAPVAGKVRQVNAAVAGDFEALAADPYGRGWLVQLEADDAAQVNALLDAAAYEAYLQSPEAQQH